MATTSDRRLASLLELARRGASPAERVLAAQRAAQRCAALGLSYLEFFPVGLPELPEEIAAAYEERAADGVDGPLDVTVPTARFAAGGVR